MVVRLWFLYSVVCVCGLVSLIDAHAKAIEEDLVSRDVYNDEDMVETQQTICQINTLQLAATAKATVTRALKGICKASYMEEYFKITENLLKNQLELLKKIEMKLETTQKPWQQNHVSESLVASGLSWNSEEFHEKRPEVHVKRIPRELEMKRYNGTMNRDSNGRNIFTYYWKLNQIEDKLLNRKSVRSANFYVTPGGYCMYMRLQTTQNGDTFYIQAGVTHGDFDETLLWPFRLKHRLTVLDQVAFNYNDIQSRLWDPTVLCSHLHWQKPVDNSDNYECLGLGISNNTLHTRNYLLSNTLTIKLVVYL